MTDTQTATVPTFEDPHLATGGVIRGPGDADEAPPDLRAVVCNYAEATGPVAKGAKAYIVGTFGGNLPENIEVMVRSRGGRWIRKWERVKKLENFRWTTVPPEHPRYRDVTSRWGGEDLVGTLERCRRDMTELTPAQRKRY